MDIFRRQKFNEAMFAKNRTLAIRVGQYQSSDIKEASFDYGYIKGDTYKPGGTCAGSAKIVFTSVITTFNKLDKVYPEIGLLVDGTYEWVKMGEYFINDIEIDRNRNTTKLDLMDGMFKLNREHITDLTYPAEIRHVIKEICLKTGIELSNEYMDITSMNYRIEQIPKDKKMTFRDVLSLATQMLGMSCFFNREGKLEVKELTDSGIVITADSYFMHGLTKSEIEYQIAGITCKKDKEILTVGLRTGRSLEIENLLMSQSALDNLYHNIKDIRYYPFNLNYQGHLLLDVGQWVTIKTNTGETFKSPVLSQSFTFKGGLRGRISADSKAGNDAQYSYAGTITKKIEQFNEIEAQIQSQLEEADKGFDRKKEELVNQFQDGMGAAYSKVEEVRIELLDTINQRFSDFDNGPLQEVNRRAEEALRNAGASSLLAQEAKRIGLDSIAKLEELKRQTTSAQTALSGDLDVLKRTIANEIRPKQAQVETEISKQVEALVQTKKELAGVKSAQSTFEQSTARRLSELTNLANGKASKSELTQTAEELTSKIASVRVGGVNLFKGSKDFSGSWANLANWTRESENYQGMTVMSRAGTWLGLSQAFETKKGEVYTLSFYIKSSINSDRINVYFTHASTNQLARTTPYMSSVAISNEWQRTSVTFEITESGFILPRIERFNTEASVYVAGLKLERGNISTDYSEAPEDIEGQISIVESSFRQRADALDAGVSRLTEGLRTKADISSLNVTAESIRQSVKSLETSTQNELNQKLNLAEFEVRASGIHQEILNATKDKADKTLVLAEAGKIREEFSNLRVGGVNLLRNTASLLIGDSSKGYWMSSSGGNGRAVSVEVLDPPQNMIKNMIRIIGNTNGGNKDLAQLVRLLIGEKYTISCYARVASDSSHANVNLLFRSWANDTDLNQKFQKSISHKNWQKYSFTFTANAIENSIQFGQSGAGIIEICAPKIESGTLATDWSPAPEDTDGLITEAKATFERTAQGLRTDLSAIQEYVNKDGQRQETLQRYTREESARQVNAVRELVNRDFVGKATYQEDVRGINQRIEEAKKNASNELTTRLANYRQTVDGKFTDISSQVTTYKQVTDEKFGNLSNQIVNNKNSTDGQIEKVRNQLAKKVEATDFQRVQETSKLYERIIGSNENDISNKVARMALTNQLFQIEVSKNEGLKTVQRQIAGSWAVQNINSGGDLISGINLGANGYNRFDGKLTHITGETLIDNAVIKSAMVDKLKTANFEAGSVTTVVLDAEAVTAEKLKVDQAFFNKLVANEAYLSQLFAKQAFINRVQSISINASQVKAGFLSGDRILGGTITGSNIYGGTLTGHTQIQLGTYGSFDTVNGGIQINVPREPDTKDGLGVQFIGSYGRGENVPYGLFIYKDSDFTEGGTAETSDGFLLTVEGYIQAKGIGWLKTGKGSVSGKTTGTIGFWDSNNVSLSFGGLDNDIYYSYNGKAYSLWSVVDQHFSDRRLKENIVDCKHKALDYIHQFQFKEYDWKKQEDRPQKAHTRIGLIAQEVQAVDPTLVYENGDTLNLDNLRLTNIALKAIQELSQRIETLERKLA